MLDGVGLFGNNAGEHTRLMNKIDRPVHTRASRQELCVPGDLRAALKQNQKAHAAFNGFPPSHRKEYIRWITDAKRDDTRARRVATAVQWMAEGKPAR